MAKQFDFTVTGKTVFPVDMLRYDSCFPSGHDDVEKLDEAIRKTYTTSQEITINMVAVGLPSPDRWESFGWLVENVVPIKR